MSETIYYLLGYRGQFGTGLGQALVQSGFDATGRDASRNHENELTMTAKISNQTSIAVQQLHMFFSWVHAVV